MEDHRRGKRNLLHMSSISEVNLTPIMDLTFILLITFIITFPLIEQGVDLDLPSGKGAALEPGKQMTLSVDASGNYFVDTRPIGLEQLDEELSTRGTVDPDLTVIIRGDKSVPYEKIMDLITRLQKAGLRKVGLVNQAREP